MQEKVSIITPAYNSEKFIAATIQSVLQQTHTHWELLIVDDCSTDTTPAIVKPFLSDARIQLLQLSKNSGTGIARSTALEKATGKYIAFLDADDIWKPQKLQKQIHFMKTKQLPFTFSFYDLMDEAGTDLQKQVTAPQKLRYRQLFFCNYVGNLTGIYDATYFGKIAIASIRKRQDWMVWLSILKQLRTAIPVPESLACYRLRQGSISASKTALLQHNFAVYRRFHQHSVFVSGLCMIGFLFTQLLIKPRFIKKIKPAM